MIIDGLRLIINNFGDTILNYHFGIGNRSDGTTTLRGDYHRRKVNF